MATEPLRLSQIIGDVVDMFIPSVNLVVTYFPNQQVRNAIEWILSATMCRPRVEVRNGIELIPSATVFSPRVKVGGSEMQTFFTLIMTDPDAPNPSNPIEREYLHWIVTDIPATTEDLFGRELVIYEAPSPVIGVHRYAFTLFKQIAPETVLVPPASRRNFSTRDFAQRNGLGLPVAAVYFTARKKKPRRRAN